MTMIVTLFKRASHIALLAALASIACSPLPAQLGPPSAKVKGPWMDTSLSPDKRADLVIAQLTLDEKISLLHGSGWKMLFSSPASMDPKSLGNAGFIPGIPRLGIPDLQMADAAVGVTHSSVFGRYSTALPSGIAEASSWDLDLAREYGALIGRELRDQGYNMSLGGGLDITREARNGRNFEYRGEDPILAGKLVGAEMKALQAQGVIGDIKHYALNDQENGRSYVNVKIGKRAMRESDLLAFEIALKDSGAAAVMCSYNLLNGVYACENDYLLNEVLKKDWGFDGFVVSDWGATHSTVKSANAGLDMEMPGSDYFNSGLKKAVESGQVPMSRLNDMLHRILRSEIAVGLFDEPPERRVPDVIHGLEVAQRIAEQSMVLLKNTDGQLPLAPAQVKSIAVIGSHADVGVLSGGGSAQVDPAGGNPVPNPPGTGIFDKVVWHRSSPLKAIQAKVPDARVEYDPGTDIASAAGLAKASSIAIVIVNQPASEGKDVPSLSLPGNQDALVNAVAAANPRTIVVIESGGPVTMPWIDKVEGVLEAWYPGIRGGEAIANILFGDVNPSAKLPVTFAKSEADLPHPQLAVQPPPREGELVEMFPGAPIKENRHRFDVEYTEGLKVGYKWFDAEDKQPLYPFGFGLSYTTYGYSGIRAEPSSVSFNLKNTGRRAGAEIAEAYVILPRSAGEPFKRLVAWQKVPLKAGESRAITLHLDPRYLSIFNEQKNAWELIPGEYIVQVGGSSRDLPLRASFQIPEPQP
jgi:beta-glucosidase